MTYLQHHVQPDWRIAMHLLDANVEALRLVSNCKNCGADMDYSGAYCSDKCQEAHQYTTGKVVAERMRKARAAKSNGKSEVAKVCVICEKSYYPKLALVHHQRTCSPECQHEMNVRHKRDIRTGAAVVVRVMRTCLHCGTMFNTPEKNGRLYCSTVCAATFKSAKRKAAMV